MRHRIVYIMNVDWDWVKQRPHFIAQHLSRTHEILIIYPYSWRRANLSKNNRSGLTLYPFFRLPFGRRSALIRHLNIFLLQKMMSLFLRLYRPDFVWVSSPELFEYLPKHISIKLIYDCMDDVLEFPRNKSLKCSLAISEKKLINTSILVFCSSNNLHDKLIARTKYAEKFVVSHNAFEPCTLLRAPEKPDCKVYTLGYIGTISSWLDFDALLKIVNAFSSVEIHLLGPIENLDTPLQQHERIKFLGTIKHEDIQASVSNFDALIMPFYVNELIQSVDPIKLYEYIYIDKPIVSVNYPEIERFSDFVDFYTNHEELITIINRYLTDGFRKKYLSKMRVQFIAKNTWAHRVAFIEEKLSYLRSNQDNM